MIIEYSNLPSTYTYDFVLHTVLSSSLSSLSPSPSLSLSLSLTHTQSSLDQWCVPLLQSCEQYMSSVLQVDKSSKEGEAGSRSTSPSTAIVNEEEAIRYLFTLGEVAQVCMNDVFLPFFLFTLLGG